MTNNIHHSFQYLRILGFNVRGKSNKLLIIISLFLSGILIILQLLNLKINNELLAIESLCLVLLITGKGLVILFNKDQIYDVSTALETFEIYELEDKYIQKLMKYLKIMLYYYRMVYVVGCSTFAGVAFYSNDSPFFCYTPPYVPNLFKNITEIYFCVMWGTVYIGFNILTLSLIVLTAIQFKQMRLKLEGIKFEEMKDSNDWKACSDTLKMCIKHDVCLINIINKLNKIVSLPLTLAMGLSILITCMDMYIVTSTEVSSSQVARSYIVAGTVTFEYLFAFGIPSQMLIDEAGGIGDSIYYNTRWYTANLPIQKIILTMLIRNQLNVCIVGEMVGTINRGTVLVIAKTAYSFYTFIKTVT